MKRWIVLILIVLVVVAAATSRLWTPPGVFTLGKRVHPPNDDPWKLVSYDPDNPYGTYLGNGFISTRVMGDGVGGKCYMAGLYDNEKLIPTPNWADLRFYDGETRFEIDKKAPYKQVLDMKTGILTTHATWRAGRKMLKGKIEVTVSRSRPGIALIEANIVPGFSGELTTRAHVPSPSDRVELIASRTMGPNSDSCLDIRSYRTRQTGICLFVASMFSSSGQAQDAGESDDSQTWIKGAKGPACQSTVQRGGELTVAKYVAVASGADEDDCERRASADLDWASDSTERLRRDHRSAWAKLWKHDIIIDGPKKDQQAIRSCMFYILQSVREGSQWSIPPMGLSNDAFSGHVFWDADVWIFPALILQHPELARSIVDYRYNTLPGAMANAKESGYQGAEYAWESGYSGREDTPPGLVYRHERHINGDVALAQWQYYLATGNNEWLRTRGYPVLKATADYWVSRVTHNAEKDRYEIHKVVPPDENAELVNNSVYTNAIAKMNLEFAGMAAEIIGAAPNPKWAQVAGKMYIPFDSKARRFVAFDDYKGYPAKQADTELVIYPLQYKMPGQNMTDIYRNTFEFHQPKVLENGPAMSTSAHAVIAARLGDSAGAYKFWLDSYAPYLRGPFNYFNEKRSLTWDQMCFLTGAAGPIQSAIFGLAGARMDYYDANADLTFSPSLPTQWKSLKVTGIQWRGKSFDLSIEEGKKPIVRPR